MTCKKALLDYYTEEKQSEYIKVLHIPKVINMFH